MAGIGFSMMRKRKIYRAMADSMKGPYDTKTLKVSGNRTKGLFSICKHITHIHRYCKCCLTKLENLV